MSARASLRIGHGTVADMTVPVAETMRAAYVCRVDRRPSVDRSGFPVTITWPLYMAEHCPLTQNPARRAKADASTAPLRAVFPKGVGEPALRALAMRNLTTMESLTTITEQQLLGMHGIGPKAVRILRDAMHLRGLSFTSPASTERS